MKNSYYRDKYQREKMLAILGLAIAANGVIWAVVLAMHAMPTAAIISLCIAAMACFYAATKQENAAIAKLRSK